MQFRLYRVWNFQAVVERAASLPHSAVIIARNLLLCLAVCHVSGCFFYFITYYDYYRKFEFMEDTKTLDDYEGATLPML
jgi:hypothetical protein